MADSDIHNDALKKEVFEAIGKKDLDGFKQVIVQIKGGVNFVDEDGMSPLQHACCKGEKAIVEELLDMGADVNYHRHGANYTSLHFAALSGNQEICRLLLDAGIDASAVNSVSRTAAQMAAFVGNHGCVETINNYVPLEKLLYYSEPQGMQNEPLLPKSILNAFHCFVTTSSLHPVRVVLNLQTLGLLKQLTNLSKVLEVMCTKELQRLSDVNELLAFKFHYLHWIIVELIRCEETCLAQRKSVHNSPESNKVDFVEVFIKRVLKENKQGQLDFVEYMVRECVREFPYRECSVYREVVAQLAQNEPLPALRVLRHAINGQRGWPEEPSYCSTCGSERPDKKCSKCRAVQYCNRECQRLHWFMHKKNCDRLIKNAKSQPAGSRKDPIDTSELRDEITKLTAQ